MEKKLKIAFDAKRLFWNREGLGSYARTLVSDMQRLHPEHEYILCTPQINKAEFTLPFLDASKYRIISSDGISDSYWRSRGVLKSLESEDVDVYFGLSNELPFGIAQSSVPSVVTIHDVLYKRFPQQFSLIDRWIYQRKFSHAISAADCIIATSQSTAKDIEHYFRPKKRMEVAYQSVSPLYRNNSENSSGQHYLVVGTINERKNLKLLIRAYALLPEKHRRPVVVVGSGKKYRKEVDEEIKQNRLGAYFTFLSGVSDVELKDLYSQSIALVFPSYYEGFGRPVVEALSSGIPVITLPNSSLPEVVGKYGIIIEYDRPELLVEALILMNDEGERKKKMIGVEEHLEQFDAEEHIKLIMNVLQEISN